MVMSKQLLEEYKKMEITALDEQILFLCKYDKYKDVIDMKVIYQQFKTAVALKNEDAIKIFEDILLQWIDMDDIETLKLYTYDRDGRPAGVRHPYFFDPHGTRGEDRDASFFQIKPDQGEKAAGPFRGGAGTF